MKIFQVKKNYFNVDLPAQIIKCSLLSVAIFLASGCSSLGVQPWERDLLAKEEMALTSSAIDSALDDHIYFSKEASSGGKGFGGGGCGCN
ncbi:MAG: hypothetical protein ACI9VT_002762 [Psychroserpens sp.]|jgi:hypothetical protein